MLDAKANEYIHTTDKNGEFRYFAIRKAGQQGVVSVYAVDAMDTEEIVYKTHYGKDRRMGTIKELENPKM